MMLLNGDALCLPNDGERKCSQSLGKEMRFAFPGLGTSTAPLGKPFSVGFFLLLCHQHLQ